MFICRSNKKINLLVEIIHSLGRISGVGGFFSVNVCLCNINIIYIYIYYIYIIYIISSQSSIPLFFLFRSSCLWLRFHVFHIFSCSDLKNSGQLPQFFGVSTSGGDLVAVTSRSRDDTVLMVRPRHGTWAHGTMMHYGHYGHYGPYAILWICGWLWMVGIHSTLGRLMMFDDVWSVFSIGLHRFAIDRSTMPLFLCRLSVFFGLAWISHIHMVQSPAHQLGQEWAKSFGRALRLETALL